MRHSGSIRYHSMMALQNVFNHTENSESNEPYYMQWKGQSFLADNDNMIIALLFSHSVVVKYWHKKGSVDER